MGGGNRAVTHREELVDVGHFAVLALPEFAFARVVVAEAGAVFGVLNLSDPVVFVPHDDAPRSVVVVLPAALVAVGVVVEAAVADVGRRMRLGLASVLVGVAPVVGGGEFGSGRAAYLAHRVQLVFVGDVVDGVVGHRKLVVLHFAGGGVDAVGFHETVEVVVVAVLGALAAVFVGPGDGRSVDQAADVAHRIVTVGHVLHRVLARAAGPEVGEAAVVGGVGVFGFDAVADLEEDALLELVIVEALQVRVGAAVEGAVHFVEVAAAVVMVADDFTVRQGEVVQAAEAVEVVLGGVHRWGGAAVGGCGEGQGFLDGFAQGAVFAGLAAGLVAGAVGVGAPSKSNC